jgi:hypothetical protein
MPVVKNRSAIVARILDAFGQPYFWKYTVPPLVQREDAASIFHAISLQAIYVYILYNFMGFFSVICA